MGDAFERMEDFDRVIFVGRNESFLEPSLEWECR